MKRQFQLLSSLAVLILLVLPAMNIISGNVHMNSGPRSWKEKLYNVDLVLPYLSSAFYPHGISISPSKVIIGKNGWLYLGDHGEKALTLRRQKFNQDDLQTIEEISQSSDAWQQFFRNQNVQSYKVMIGPDKANIYPEHLPIWAQPDPNSATELLLNSLDDNIFINTRSALLDAKEYLAEPLYYRTDTHWNSLGAKVAFQSFMRNLSDSVTDLKWELTEEVSVQGVMERTGGDLANFLRMTESLIDTELVVKKNENIETKIYDYHSGSLINDHNQTFVISRPPLLVKTDNALNKKRVLWLRDSFGVAMLPYMAESFTEVLILHYDAAEPEKLVELVERYEPDFVFVTAVERRIRTKWFRTFPPRFPNSDTGRLATQEEL